MFPYLFSINDITVLYIISVDVAQDILILFATKLYLSSYYLYTNQSFAVYVLLLPLSPTRRTLNLELDNLVNMYFNAVFYMVGINI